MILTTKSCGHAISNVVSTKQNSATSEPWMESQLTIYLRPQTGLVLQTLQVMFLCTKPSVKGDEDTAKVEMKRKRK